MAYQIKVNADLGGFRRDMSALGKELEKGISSKRKIQLFDRDTRDFIAKGAKDAIAGMRREINKLEDANKQISDELKKQNISTEDQKKKTNELIRNKRQLLQLEKEVGKTQAASDSVLSPGTKAGQFGKGFKGVFGGVGQLLSKIPGLGKVLGGAAGGAGLGMMGMLGGGAAAGILGLGALAVGRGMAGYNKFNENKGSMIQMMGRGWSESEASLRDPRFAALGVNAEALRQSRLQMVDYYGRGGASAGNMLGLHTAARGLGVDSSTLISQGAGLSKVMGAEAGQKTFARLLATSISTELDGAIGPWLETTAEMLTSINENGLGLDSAALQVMANLAKAGTGMSPAFVSKAMGNLDSAIKGATGENAAFYMSALASRGIGAESLGMSQIAMSQGLFGGSADKANLRKLLPEKELQEFIGAGILADGGAQGEQKAFQNRAGAISETFNSLTAGMGAAGKALVASKLTNIKDPVAAREAMALLEKASTGPLTKEEQATLEDLGRDVNERMLDRLTTISKSVAGGLDISQTSAADMSEKLGQQLAPLGTITNNLLAGIDGKMASLLSYFNISAGPESAANQMASRAAQGNLTDSEMAQLGQSESSDLKAALIKESARAQEMAEVSKMGGLGRAVAAMTSKNVGIMDVFSPGNSKDHKNAADKMVDALLKLVKLEEEKRRKPQNTNVQGSLTPQGRSKK